MESDFYLPNSIPLMIVQERFNQKALLSIAKTIVFPNEASTASQFLPQFLSTFSSHIRHFICKSILCTREVLRSNRHSSLCVIHQQNAFSVSLFPPINTTLTIKTSWQLPTVFESRNFNVFKIDIGQ